MLPNCLPKIKMLFSVILVMQRLDSYLRWTPALPILPKPLHCRMLAALAATAIRRAAVADPAQCHPLVQAGGLPIFPAKSANSRRQDGHRCWTISRSMRASKSLACLIL